MRCEEVSELLIEYAEGTLPPDVAAQVEAALPGCDQCQEDLAAIMEFRTMASSWHDEVPPAWKIPEVSNQSAGIGDFLEGFRQWFPTFASATALVLVAVLYAQTPAQTGQLPSGQMTDYESLPQLPTATQAAFDSALETNREQRKQELTTLLEMLTAEMNRRSLETEESMRFLISSQIEEQRELDQLYRQVDALLKDGQASVDQPATETPQAEGVNQ